VVSLPTSTVRKKGRQRSYTVIASASGAISSLGLIFLPGIASPALPQQPTLRVRNDACIRNLESSEQLWCPHSPLPRTHLPCCGESPDSLLRNTYKVLFPHPAFQRGVVIMAVFADFAAFGRKRDFAVHSTYCTGLPRPLTHR
jgi:hypothetical protein